MNQADTDQKIVSVAIFKSNNSVWSQEALIETQIGEIKTTQKENKTVIKLYLFDSIASKYIK